MLEYIHSEATYNAGQKKEVYQKFDRTISPFHQSAFFHLVEKSPTFDPPSLGGATLAFVKAPPFVSPLQLL